MRGEWIVMVDVLSKLGTGNEEGGVYCKGYK